ncbi:Cy173 [Cynomolgus cytomegalovirus]|uniref:Protein UL153 n=1 Tax=Cynomolgus macaque cytomegalovirus strain Mauritius TaxID=1690255 RepID=A0A0K1GZP8_9BETA|nr:Cy173 [Cynomolgus cytomegalovirus]AKT72692.1 protein UL153 [Cynomolgus macaque cytomegalovirus strain Mauritius]APT39380.1 Cy173 [Cynomolgus cytomegalovirus]APT39531.1 Cy173 [Cynomolgus cytomegalovirus]APT39726.1 Cy173 [Cynomolgus cytomegalovirus]APT39877.1 Cy173 [Cynomolgus cytomegalovirus]
MHFRISYLIKDRTIYIFIAILSRYAAANNTSTVATTTNATSTFISTSPISTTNMSVTSTITSTALSTSETTANVSTPTQTQNTVTSSGTVNTSSTDTSITTNISTSSAATVTSSNSSEIFTNTSGNTTITTSSSAITTTPTSTHNINITSINSTVNTTTTRTSTAAVLGYTLVKVNATVGETVNLTATNFSITTHHHTYWVLMHNKTGKPTEHELCRTSGSHQTKHHYGTLCYNCSKSTLMLYNVTHNDSRRYVLKTQDNSPKPEAFDLTVTSGNGTSYPNSTPDFCTFVSSAPPTSSTTVNVYLQDVAAPATHAVWALALVITVVVALMFGQGRMRRMRYYRQRHSDDREELIVKYRPERRRLTTGYEQMYISS